MAHLLGAEALHLEYPNRVIFDSVTIGLDEGQRIGIVGRNGDGKSTLMRLMAGTLEPNSGRVTRRGGILLGMLDQADEMDDDETVAHAIVGDRPEYEWASDQRVRDVLDGLVEGVPWEARIGQLSGGQRRRVALAALLVGDWDIIFLDEPTNHLDVEGIAWLAQHLKRRWNANAGALVVVTHDRWFLDEICTDTWEVHDRLIEPFEGGYAAYILQRVERDRSAAASESKRQNLMRKELAWLGRGAPARSTKPKFRIDAANELIANEPPPRNKITLASMAMQRLGKDVVDLENISVTYEDKISGGTKQVLKDVTWRIAPGERTGILGVNGAGKSTLLSLVTGSLLPTTGNVKRGKTIKVATLTQQLGELADIWEDRVSEVLGRQKSTYVAGGKEMTPSQLLERVGFGSDALSNKVRELSGGQKRRLQLLLIILDEPNVLILDEPTNDLDTDMLAAIEDLLDSYPGTLLVVSHDRYLLERVTDQQYAVLGGNLRHLPGGVDEYLQLRSGQLSAATASANAANNKAKQPENSNRPKGAELRAAEKELSAAGRKIEKSNSRIQELHVLLATHDQSDYAGLGKLSDELAKLEKTVGEVESRWLELTELLS
ncbi:MAG: transporter ATP-binding protein [Glaciihabitans sp.]|nr:transporter ATP-binding protein [Glaciihabitans sp.]